MVTGSLGQLVGRGNEFDHLDRLLERVRTGIGGIALVVGAPGIGKTALITAVGLSASARNITVLRGAASGLERRAPFAAIRACLPTGDLPDDPLLERVHALLRGEGILSTGVAHHEFTVVETILTLMDRWTALGPVLLVLDDAQWADPSSLLILRRLAETVRELPLVMIVATRSVPDNGSLSSVLAEFVPDARLLLGPLNKHDVGVMAQRVIGSPAGPELTEILAGAGGNPLYVMELVAALSQEGVISVVDGVADVGIRLDGDRWRHYLPKSLSEAILQRLSFLPDIARQVLPMAAVLGPSIEVVELSKVLGAAVIDIWQAVRIAVDTELLIEEEGEFVFRHDLIRQVFAGQISMSTVAALKAHAVQVLISEHISPERVAHYMLSGHGPLDRRSLDWLVETAESLIVSIPDAAVTLLDRALATPAVDDSIRDALSLLQIRALVWNDRLADGEALIKMALASHRSRTPDVDITLHRLLYRVCIARGNLQDAVAESESMLRRPDLLPEEEGRHHGFNAVCYFFLEQFAAAEHSAMLAISGGAAHGNSNAMGNGYLALGALRYTQGRLDEAFELSDRIAVAIGPVAQSGQVDSFDVYSLRGHCLIELDRLVEAEQVLESAVYFHQLNPAGFLAGNLSAKARLYFLDGRWDDGLAEIRACREAPDIFGFALVGHSLAALIDVHRGTLRVDSDTIPGPDDRFGSRAYLQFHPWVRALLHEAQGRPQQALDLLFDICQQFAAGLTASTLYYVYPDVARLAAVTGDEAKGREIAVAAAATQEYQSTSSRRGTALLCRGLADSQPELIAEAAQAFRLAGRPLYEGCAYESLAAVCTRAGRLAEAHAALHTAVELYTRLEAEWDVARAEAWLRELGIRRGRRGPRKRPKTGWASLTATENKVAVLVGDGLSNSDIATQMFLSRRTVQSHVSSILVKLQLNSRLQVAVNLKRDGG